MEQYKSKEMEVDRSSKRYQKNLTWIFVVFSLILAFLIIRPLIPIILAAFILSYLFYPFYDLLIKRIFKRNNSLSKTLSAGITLLLIIMVILLPLALFVTGLISQNKKISHFLMQQLPTFFNHLDQILPYSLTSFLQNMGIEIQIAKLYPAFAKIMINFIQSMLIELPALLLGSFVALFIIYYLLKHGPEIEKWIFDLIPLNRSKSQTLRNRFDHLARGFLVSHLVIALVQGLAMFLVLLIISYQHFVLLSVLTVFMALMPLLGAISVWIPICIHLFLQIPEGGAVWKAVLMLFYGIGVISMIDNIVRPRLMSQNSEIHPVTILVGVLGGILLFGFPGILIGPLVLGSIDIIVELYKETLS